MTADEIADLRARLAQERQNRRTLAIQIADYGQNAAPLYLLNQQAATEERPRALAALNTLLESHDPLVTWLAVGCRTLEYQELGQRLKLTAALELQPITAEMALPALVQAGTATLGLRHALEADSALAALLDTPLTLNLAVRAYAGQEDSVMGTTEAERWQPLYRLRHADVGASAPASCRRR